MDYLYYLQTLREGSLAFLTPVLTAISEWNLTLSPLIVILFYWCVNKTAGEWMVFNFTASNFLNGIVKLTACVYRPWIKDSRLHLDPGAVESSSGYSFPSGHSAAAASVFGSIAVQYRKKKGVVIFCTVITLLVMFARNWLGAHTLQDVWVSLFLTIGVVLLSRKYASRCQDGSVSDVKQLLIVIGLCVIGALYTALKKYPLDYDAAGNLLVDPVLMQQDTYGAIGLSFGRAIGMFIERRYIGFSSDGTKKQRIVRGVIGAVLFALLYLVVFKKLFLAIFPANPSAYLFCRYFCVVLFATVLYPLCIKKLEPKLFKTK